ncbi:helix-turn-helix domain-containing protein [Propionivibrio sp.]|uniref:ArsR/SmtB family transcription factor n=1 Tax=Propionivibrio sp. TaxID=2212460 RepID=UPI0025DF3FF1|nr:helix-turn-helix domain-containing protein [Propionivibrio sp.]MBK7357163.1 helix-turn-helix transcriptional regulator [Propionivibrio sp.]
MSRPLAHPNSEDITVAGILHALADPVRLAIVSELLKAEAGLNCTQMTDRLEVDMPKSTCSQHYRILRESGLIVSERKGVELTSHVRLRELETRFPGLLNRFSKRTNRKRRKLGGEGVADRAVARTGRW